MTRVERFEYTSPAPLQLGKKSFDKPRVAKTPKPSKITKNTYCIPIPIQLIPQNALEYNPHSDITL